MAVKRIVPDLPLKDVEATRAFYGDVLGLQVGMDLGWVMNFGSPDVQAAQVNLIRRDATAPVDPEMTIEVTDVERIYAACLDRRLPIVYPLTDEPWGVRRFFVRDPNGVLLNILAHLPADGSWARPVKAGHQVTGGPPAGPQVIDRVPSDVGRNLCPECGAALDSGESCEERFHRCLALEYEDWTGYGAVHHLTVPAYMLQHPGRYSREGWLEARRLLAAFLSGTAPAEVRSQNRARLDSGRRPWRMAGGEPVAPPPGATCSRTISDLRLDDPATYCAGVVEWARAVLADTAGWEN